MNEVEAAGNTPLHSCCYEGWIDGAKLLLDLGAKMNASNNAGDRPIHWAQNMGHDELEKFLREHGADESQGGVLVPDHVPKVKDFFEKECWAHHPMPHRYAPRTDARPADGRARRRSAPPAHRAAILDHRARREFIEMRHQIDDKLEKERNALVPGAW